jgi:predicted nucleotidyltransferase
MQREITALTGRLTRTFGDRLVSVILYGSAAEGDHDERFSDLNIFCVLREVTPKELADSEPIFRWWRELGQPAPLLMSEEEARASTDCFPIEFQDMKGRRKVLHGRDVIADLEIGRKFWRAQLEHELRVKLIRLRQQATAVLSDQNGLLKLCADSVSTFVVLGRHAALYSGRDVKGSKREIVRALEDTLGAPLDAFHALLDLRAGKTAPQDVEPVPLFRKYLDQIGLIISFVDRLEERKA